LHKILFFESTLLLALQYAKSVTLSLRYCIKQIKAKIMPTDAYPTTTTAMTLAALSYGIVLRHSFTGLSYDMVLWQREIFTGIR